MCYGDFLDCLFRDLPSFIIIDLKFPPEVIGSKGTYIVLPFDFGIAFRTVISTPLLPGVKT